MFDKGNERLYQELEKFIITRLRPLKCFNSLNEDIEKEYEYEKVQNKLKGKYCLWKSSIDIVYFPQLTNHEICHEMFWNAYKGRSRMYIQLPNLTSEISTKWVDEEDTITLSCSLLTLQMLDYDIMMFRAMEDQEDQEYRDAATNYYRPYLFNFVAEIDQKKYKELQKLQIEKYGTTSENIRPDERNVWLECTFIPTTKSLVDLNGYVVQSASSINKIKAHLSIIEDHGTSLKVKKAILDNYVLKNAYKQDDEFIKELRCELNDCLSSIYVYRIGNGNCVYAENKKKDLSFFFDIGFNHRHRPKWLSPTSTYNYSSAMKKILSNNPSFFILSHWDLDHIAGSFAARKDFLNKKWFAPDCLDACTDATRLAKYLDMKGNLFCVTRNTGRMIGEININKKATYKLFIGEKASCDSSYPNCEGIFIKYKDADNTVMMMGDVNYASFNKAINNYNASCTTNPELPFAETPIDYLIVPHHGSKHTAYNLIIDNKPIIKGTEAIICCKNEKDRPYDPHKDELKKRFKVSTTEDAKAKNYIEILL